MKFVTTPEQLVVQLNRREQVASLKAKLVLDRSQITRLCWCDTFEEWRRWEVRFPGTALPYRLLAGSYWTAEGWDFLYVRRPVGVSEPVALNVIVIELAGHDKYSRIIITAREEDFLHLDNWYKKHQKTAKKVAKKKRS